VRTCRVSKLLPQQSVRRSPSQNMKPLALKTRTFCGEFMDRNSEFSQAGSVLAYYACAIAAPSPCVAGSSLRRAGEDVGGWRGSLLRPERHQPGAGRRRHRARQWRAGEHEALIASTATRERLGRLPPLRAGGCRWKTRGVQVLPELWNRRAEAKCHPCRRGTSLGLRPSHAESAM